MFCSFRTWRESAWTNLLIQVRENERKGLPSPRWNNRKRHSPRTPARQTTLEQAWQTAATAQWADQPYIRFSEGNRLVGCRMSQGSENRHRLCQGTTYQTIHIRTGLCCQWFFHTDTDRQHAADTLSVLSHPFLTEDDHTKGGTVDNEWGLLFTHTDSFLSVCRG